ncbi:hypothetical protein M011DRAFT_394886 [Sporormia fimetaria CBS 119925]|uniref:J domain-containing protein n=1 Tax=Sporormia fimetaria CBS 119925 TaxID=1340428 RepID=A0A6A6VMZ5_9PLEO|nr:hypothetical protein M011DRAFT_394886 [Sporormia fimetaria CBS 119925]
MALDLWSDLAPLFIWQFLIPWAADWIQTILYAVFLRAGDPKPQPGTRAYREHNRQILIAVYVAYFAFNIYELDFDLQRHGSAYTDLGVPIDVDESSLASHFRKLTIRYHPDKVKGNVDREKANEYFAHLVHMRDIILDPVKRFVYDRFGPTTLRQCSRCVTIGDYMHQALLGKLYNYVALIIGLFVANALGYRRQGSYWYYLAILAVATFDARSSMRPDHAPLLTNYLNPLLTSMGARSAYLPFQATRLMRKASLSATYLLTVLLPLWHPEGEKGSSSSGEVETRHKQIDRLESAVKGSSQLATRLIDMETTPYRHNMQAKNNLKEALKRYMMTNAVHMDRDVRNAMGESYARRRAGVPHGAKGTR